MSCVKVANDNDGYGSGNMCQLPSIEGNEFESTKVVTNNTESGNTCLRLRRNKSNNDHVLHWLPSRL